jgi:PleD family two-component response regulator
MTNGPFYEEGSRVLTPRAFQFVLDSELKRAVRSQNFLTLVVLEAKREWEGLMLPADEGTVQKVAQVIGREVRDTDLLGNAEGGTLCLVLLDADYEHSAKVIDRLISRIENYDFPAPMRIAIGAACYPTHAVDAEGLRKEALARPLVQWRSSTNMSGRN